MLQFISYGRALVFRRLKTFACFSLLITIGTHSTMGQCDYLPNSLPVNWQDMEVEAKWLSNSTLYNTILSDFVDGSNYQGYKVNVRWGGISRKFVDNYYDDVNSTLTNNLKALRHRIRYKSNSPTNNLSDLQKATWTQDWQKVQYKSTPFRYGAVWFREEVGDCEISAGLCSCNILSQIMADVCPNRHPAMTMLFSEHPGYNISTNIPRSTVVDYRYRIELTKNGEAIYELSLDRIVNGAIVDYEVELELIRTTKTQADVDELFRLTGIIENTYTALIPSIKSKGDITVPEDQWDKLIDYNISTMLSNVDARNQITVDGISIFATGGITLNAGKRILITQGFHAYKNSYFKAGLLDCPSGNSKNAILNVSKPERPIVLQDSKNNIDIQVFPNPTDGELSILTSGSEIGNVTIYNLSGMAVFSKYSKDKQVRLSLKGKPTGFYLIKVQSNDGVSVKTVILNK